MKSFINEADNTAQAKISLVNFISTNLTRLASSNSIDQRPIILLTAALGILNSSEDVQTVSTARRIAQIAISVRPPKK